jgi:hypothetical protein
VRRISDWFGGRGFRARPFCPAKEVIMTCSNDIRSKRLPSAKLVTGLGLCALLALGTFATLAHAEDHHGWHGHDRHGYYGGYYGAPPIVYGSPYYAPPPVVYGPGIGINLPGIAIGIR